MWDMYGLETLFNITDWEKLHMWNVLKDESPPSCPNPKLLIIRAMANVQRRYEIFIFETDGLDEAAVREAFLETPQFMANFIRKNGYKLYSHPADDNKVVIK